MSVSSSRRHPLCFERDFVRPHLRTVPAVLLLALTAAAGAVAAEEDQREPQAERPDPDPVPLWTAASQGDPDWDAIFAGFRSCSDYPSASYWRELAEYYPQARVVLTTRDPDSWFVSVSETIFSDRMMGSLRGMFSDLL